MANQNSSLCLPCNTFLPISSNHRIICNIISLYYDDTFFNPQNWNILEKIISSVKPNILQILERKATIFLKGQCHEIFRFCFFSWFSFPHAPDYTIRAVSNFFENSPRYSQLKVCHRCRWHRWQMEKSSIRKIYDFFWTPLGSRVSI